MNFSRHFKSFVNNKVRNKKIIYNINIKEKYKKKIYSICKNINKYMDKIIVFNYKSKESLHKIKLLIFIPILIIMLEKNYNIVWARDVLYDKALKNISNNIETVINRTENNTLNKKLIFVSDTKNQDSNSSMDLSGLDDFDFSDIQNILKDNQSTADISFREIVEKLIRGDTKSVFSMIVDAIKNQLFLQIDENKNSLTQVILIAIVASIFTNFSDVFTKNGISELSFYITYLLLITLLCTSFMTIMQISSELIKLLISFMKVLIPAYFIAVAFVGGTVTSAAFYQFTLMLITVLEAILLYLILPAIQIYVLIIFVNNLSKEDILSKLAELLEIIINWTLKTIFGVMLGFQLIQSLILPYIDALKTNTVQKAIAAIPGIGGGASAVSEIIMGSGIIIKNGIGVAGLIIIIFLAIIPTVKLVIICLLYYGASAVIQPISDKRIVESVTAVAKGSAMTLKACAIAALLLILTIAIICVSTNIAR